MEEDEDIINARIAINVQKYRLRKNLSIADLAFKCGMDRANLSRIEHGWGNHRINTIQKIANALGVSLRELMEKPDSN